MWCLKLLCLVWSGCYEITLLMSVLLYALDCGVCMSSCHGCTVWISQLAGNKSSYKCWIFAPHKLASYCFTFTSTDKSHFNVKQQQNPKYELFKPFPGNDLEAQWNLSRWGTYGFGLPYEEHAETCCMCYSPSGAGTYSIAKPLSRRELNQPCGYC